MASLKTTLTGTYVQVSVGSATIQKIKKGFGEVFVFAGGVAPGDDTDSMLISTNDPQYFETEDSIYARTPHGVDVDIVVMS